MSGRVLLDEMFHPRIAADLAERGHDCRSVAADPLLRQRSDADLMAVALAERRALITNNVIDFERLRRGRAADGATVPQLIYTSDATFPRDRRFLRRMIEALDAALKTDAVTQHGGVLWLAPTE